MTAPTALDPWAALDATDQARLVAEGEVPARELVLAAIARIERLGPLLGAVPVRRFEEALAQAGGQAASGGPFAGVPFLMKDLGARQAGQPYYAGNRALRDADHRADADTPLGARFREIGLVTVGNSSTPEFGLQSSTWPLAYGPARNPWDPTRSPGGSSGGACAAVAAGLVPVAHATDGAGSIRIPAAWCGLVGLKPSRDRIVWRHLGRKRSDVEFVVARSLRDTARLLAYLDDAARPRRPVVAWEQALTRRARGLRIGLWTETPAAEVDPRCVAAVERTAERLVKAGHRVAPEAPAALLEHDERSLHGALFGLLEYRGCLIELAQRLGRDVEARDVEPFLWEIANDQTAVVHPGDLERSVAWMQGWVRRVLGFFDDHDLLLTPTVPVPAPTLHEVDPARHSPLDLLGALVPHMAFTEPWNATGLPALSLPLASTETGLPIGVQLVAGPGREDLLLSLAAELLADLEPRRPAIHA